MGRGFKYDHSPLLAPGRHLVTLSAIERLCVVAFPESASRPRLFYAFEEFVQRFLRERIPCEMLVDGSFLTTKLNPDDVDVAVRLDLEVAETLTYSQQLLVDDANAPEYISGVDSFVFISYPRGHELFRSPIDESDDWAELYGIDGRVWLKGIAVMLIWETDVGLLIRR